MLKKKKIVIIVIIVAIFLLLMMFSDDTHNTALREETKTPSEGLATQQPAEGVEGVINEPIETIGQPFGDRKVFLALTTGQNDTDLTPSLRLATQNGFDGPGDINVDWGAIEPQKGVQQDPDGIFKWARQNLKNTPVHLTVAPIQSSYVSVPSDLVGSDWDDPELIDRYLELLEYISHELRGVPILTIAIGNEVDIVLLKDKKKWAQYTTLFEAAKIKASELWPEAEIGVKMVKEAVLDNSTKRAGPILASSDAILVTYYPDVTEASKLQNQITKDFENITNLFPNKNIHVVEAGYPSSSALGSSEEDQAEFVRAIFAAWDTYPTSISSIVFVWSHELPPETVATLTDVYGTDDTEFIEWISTLGYWRYDQTEKPAAKALQAEIDQRK